MTQEIEKRPDGREMSKQELDEIELRTDMQMAKALSHSAMFAKRFNGNPADVLGAVMLGKSMGIEPISALTSINVINGTPTASAMLIAALIRRAGHRIDYQRDEKRLVVSCTITRADDGSSVTETWSMDRAKRMGLAGRGMWAKDPMTMLSWRALTSAARLAVPDVVLGLAYTPEEIQSSAQHVTARVVPDIQPTHAYQGDGNAPLGVEPDEPEQVDVVDTDGVQDDGMSSWQARGWVHESMVRAGVRTAAQAMLVLKDLTGRDGLADTDQLTDAEALSLADGDYEAIANAVRNLHSQEPQDATPQDDAADATPADTKEGTDE
ncbi:recombinase RecT [Pseudoscardovia suis]